jgi:anti-sigma factor RsiW
MKCQEIESALLGGVNGRLDPKERVALETHLGECPACRTRAEEFRKVWGALDWLPAVEPSPTFDARLRARLAAEKRPARWWTRWLLEPRFVVAVAALVVLAVWLGLRPPWGHRQPVASPTTASQGQAAAEQENDFRVVKDLPVFENYDVVSNFEALSALSGVQSSEQSQSAE